jgi:hypothetical protein
MEPGTSEMWDKELAEVMVCKKVKSPSQAEVIRSCLNGGRDVITSTLLLVIKQRITRELD